MKISLFEFEDLAWFPNTIRESMTDYLRYFLGVTNLYQPITTLIKDGLDKSNSSQIIDLCSGSGGSIEQIQNNLRKQFNQETKIILTDKFPNINAYEFLKKKTKGQITYVEFPVDASQVPTSIKGFRTIFSGFHHFDRHAAKSVLKNSVDAKEGIGIFDGGDKNILPILGIVFIHPIIFFLCTPFFKPFRFSRLLFTYIIPVIPFCTVWDGIISITRLYWPTELLKLAKEVDENYIWKAGKVRSKFGLHIAYLVGYPEK